MKKLAICLILIMSLSLVGATVTRYGNTTEAYIDITSDPYIVLMGGDIGVNTTDPNETLDVDGTAQVEKLIVDYPDSGIFLLSTTPIALNADADTTIYTVPTGYRCILSHATLVVGADAGTTDISIGQDGAETDFVGAIDLANIDAQYDACRLAPVPVAATASAAKEESYAAGTVIEAKVTNQAGGATNTIYLFGTLY